MSECILTHRQFRFLQANHELVEYAIIEGKKGHHALLDMFIASEQYQRVFGNMGWDDILDRYQDTPGYDISLRMALHEQLRKDVEAGMVTLWEPPPRKTNPDDSVEIDFDEFRKEFLMRKSRNEDLNFEDDE
jgi:hypothetical protein